MNYFVVLFKNKKKKKIIKKFITYKKSKSFYDSEMNKSNLVIFDTLVENGHPCNYELGLVSTNSSIDHPLYTKDDLGRNIRVFMENENMHLIEVRPYKKEETLFDIKNNKKITSKTLIKNYLNTNNLKIIYSLNNKIIIQNDNDFNIFSLKTESETFRFLDCISNFLINENRMDCLVVKDNSTHQRKYLIKLLSDNGFNKNLLYRKCTTYTKL